MLVPLASKKKKKSQTLSSKQYHSESEFLPSLGGGSPHWEAEKEGRWGGGRRGGGGEGRGSTSRPVVASTKCHWTKSRIDEVSLDEKSHRRSVVGRTVASTKCRRGNKYRRAVKAFGVLNSAVPEYHP